MVILFDGDSSLIQQTALAVIEGLGIRLGLNQIGNHVNTLHGPYCRQQGCKARTLVSFGGRMSRGGLSTGSLSLPMSGRLAPKLRARVTVLFMLTCSMCIDVPVYCVISSCYCSTDSALYPSLRWRRRCEY